MIPKKLITLIHIAKAQLGLADDIYRDILFVQCDGAESSKELTVKQAEKLLDHFRSLGWKPRRSKRPRVRRSPAPRDLPTPEMLRLMDRLYAEIGWTDRSRRMGFNATLCGGKPWPQTRAEAIRVIEALKQMGARGYSERVRKERR